MSNKIRTNCKQQHKQMQQNKERYEINTAAFSVFQAAIYSILQVRNITEFK